MVMLKVLKREHFFEHHTNRCTPRASHRSQNARCAAGSTVAGPQAPVMNFARFLFAVFHLPSFISHFATIFHQINHPALPSRPGFGLWSAGFWQQCRGVTACSTFSINTSTAPQNRVQKTGLPLWQNLLKSPVCTTAFRVHRHRCTHKCPTRAVSL